MKRFSFFFNIIHAFPFLKRLLPSLLLSLVQTPAWSCGSPDNGLAEHYCFGGIYDLMDCQTPCTRSAECFHEYCGSVCQGGEQDGELCVTEGFKMWCQAGGGLCVETCHNMGKCTADKNALGLAQFAVTTQVVNGKHQIQAQWQGYEQDNELMNIYCAQMQSDQFTPPIKINQSPISPNLNDSSSGKTSYSIKDYIHTDELLKPGVYYCVLEDIDSAGYCTTHCDQISAVIIGDQTQSIQLNAAQTLCEDIVRKQLQQFGHTGSCIH